MDKWYIYAIIAIISAVLGLVMGRKKTVVVENNDAEVEKQEDLLQDAKKRQEGARDELKEKLAEADEDAEELHQKDPDDIDLGNRFSDLIDRMRTRRNERTGGDESD